MTMIDTTVTTPASLLEANLAALLLSSPRAARQIAATLPRDDIEFIETDEGLSARLDGRLLASRRRPREEAERFAAGVDVSTAGGIVVLGFGLGYHLDAISKRVKNTAMLVVFEPDLGLLRAVFERIDCREWLLNTPTVIVTEPDDAGAISDATQKRIVMLAMGVTVVQHPASEQRLGADARSFSDQLLRVVNAMRTNVITTLVQMDVTLRNVLMNLDHYVTGGRINELKGAATGFPGIVVSAGPSLRRNIALLKDPRVRERCVIVAVQTVLKPLLREGIRPHFVTALDFHEISGRFYEGLTPADVEGITLIAEPKANAAITEGFPGPVRMLRDENLELLLGEARSRGHDMLPSGATVAHLAYGVARYLGCDPVILMGQDLAFSDGQYYAPGAAIHDVWGPELSGFNTLEMMEWERIVRMKAHLHKLTDHSGRSIYTDNQMATYLAAFEREFLRDVEQGRTVIDATEGGAAKQHSTAMSLREALEQHVYHRADCLPELPAPPERLGREALCASEAVKAIDRHVRDVTGDVKRVGRLSRQAARHLDRIAKTIEDDAATNREIRKVYRLRDQVTELSPAYDLVHTLNQIGGFKRVRADRALRVDEDSLSPHEKQRRQTERDQTNVRWLADAADVMTDLLEATSDALRGGAKRTRDLMPEAIEEMVEDRPRTKGAANRQVIAVIPYDPDSTPLGRSRTDAGAHLRATISRLRQCRSPEHIVVATGDEGATRDHLADLAAHIEVRRVDRACSSKRRRALGVIRAFASGWRGCPGHLSVFDEIFDAPLIDAALEGTDACGALLIGPDWVHLDPVLNDQLVERMLESPEVNRLTFSQAPPGIAGCVLARPLLADFAAAQAAGSAGAQIGAMLGYLPTRPVADPVARPVCIQVPPEVRQSPHRFIPDRSVAREYLHHATVDGESDAAQISASLEALDQSDTPRAPQHLVLEITTRRALKGSRIDHLQARTAERADMPVNQAIELVQDFAAGVPDGCVTFSGSGDPLLHSRFADIAAAASDAGLVVHARTDLPRDHAPLDHVHVLSIDLVAGTASTYAALSGADEGAYRGLLERLDVLIKSIDVSVGLPEQWLIPRITRCDEVYEEIEGFYDKWNLIVGAAVIDPMPRPVDGQRVECLPPPRNVMLRHARDRMMILSDGTAAVCESEIDRSGTVRTSDGWERAWAEIWSARTTMFRRGESIWTGR